MSIVQRAEALARAAERGQDRGDLLGAADRRGRFDRLPYQAELAHVTLGHLHLAHVGQERFDR
jgi:hypothetical protein